MQQQSSSQRFGAFVPDTILPGYQWAPHLVPARTPTVHWGPISGKAVGGPNHSSAQYTVQKHPKQSLFLHILVHEMRRHSDERGRPRKQAIGRAKRLELVVSGNVPMRVACFFLGISFCVLFAEYNHTLPLPDFFFYLSLSRVNFRTVRLTCP